MPGSSTSSFERQEGIEATLTYRQGNQEYFQVDLDYAKSVIEEECFRLDEANRVLAAEKQAHRLAAQRRLAEETEETQLREKEIAERQALDRRIEAEAEARAEFERARILEDIRVERGAFPDSASQNNRGGQSNINESAFRQGAAANGVYREHFSAAQQTGRRSVVLVANVVIGSLLLLAAMLIWILGTWGSSTEMSHPTITPQSTSGESVVDNSPGTSASQSKTHSVDVAVTKAIEKFPFLGTSAGQAAIVEIRMDRDKRIAAGVAPADAIRQAVDSIAPKYAPKENKKVLANPSRAVRPPQTSPQGDRVANTPSLVIPSANSAVVDVEQLSIAKRPAPMPVESGSELDRGNHPGFDPRCRWLNSSTWTCK